MSHRNTVKRAERMTAKDHPSFDRSLSQSAVVFDMLPALAARFNSHTAKPARATGKPAGRVRV